MGKRRTGRRKRKRARQIERRRNRRIGKTRRNLKARVKAAATAIEAKDTTRVLEVGPEKDKLSAREKGRPTIERKAGVEVAAKGPGVARSSCSKVRVSRVIVASPEVDAAAKIVAAVVVAAAVLQSAG